MKCPNCGGDYTTGGCGCPPPGIQAKDPVITINHQSPLIMNLHSINYKLDLLLKLLIIDKLKEKKDEYNWEHLDLYKLEDTLVRELANILGIEKLDTCDVMDRINVTIDELKSYFKDLKINEKEIIAGFVIEQENISDKFQKFLDLIIDIIGLKK